LISVVECHTAGESVRIILSGIPNIPGKNMKEKKEYFSKNFENFRNALMFEPRGHTNMFGALLTSPCNPEADIGVIFMHPTGYPDGCGHGSIGIATVIVETGLIEPVEPCTRVVLDTPSGLVTCYVKVRNGEVEEVTIRNVPAFLYKSMEVHVPGLGEITADIAFGGNFYVIVSAEDIGLSVEPKNAYKLSEIGMKIKRSCQSQMEVHHPEMTHINKIASTLIYDKPRHPEADAKNVVITALGRQDRSPCGTGTCARMATLWAKGKLGLNEEFVNESIIGTIFRGRLISQVSVGNFKAVVPEITGSAYITGFSNFVINPKDPLKWGFLLS
jgi:proline racemase